MWCNKRRNKTHSGTGKAIIQNDGGDEARAQGLEEGGGIEVGLGREGPLVVLGARAQVNPKVFDAVTKGGVGEGHE